MNINTQIKKLDHYDVHERSLTHKVGAIVLAVATVFSIAVETNHATKGMAKSEVIVNSNYLAVRPEPAEKNEMVRMPIKFDDGLRAAATTGA
ncbi:hypothetical protein H7097_00550 [Aeromicrobium sp.]|nr:hypothetical protein [Candidatus Saccharibacteria bacterium]